MNRDRNIAADIPRDLLAADELLRRYGRWAMHRHKKMRCGSAEGGYRIPPNDDDRQPRESLLAPFEALNVQRALQRVPDRERIVLAVLYVPQRVPAHVILQRMRIPARLSRERHLLGLRMFENTFRVMTLVAEPR